MKNNPIVFTLFGNNDCSDAISQALGYSVGKLTVHSFPDEETVVRILTPIQHAQVIFISTLDRPNSKIVSLLFAAKTARELGAAKVGLIAPYLAYMRQDKQFDQHEGITSKYFAEMISEYFDWMMTIDPHLHRWHSLSNIYSIPTQALHANARIAEWLKQHVTNPVLIGPDSESSQWVSEIAKMINAPSLILRKVRAGDKQVHVSVPQIAAYKEYTPVLVDDIISTAATMIATVKQLQVLNLKPPVCIGVHAVFAGVAYENLLQAGAAQIVTCNTIAHVSNGIDVNSVFIAALKLLLID